MNIWQRVIVRHVTSNFIQSLVVCSLHWVRLLGVKFQEDGIGGVCRKREFGIVYGFSL